MLVGVGALGRIRLTCRLPTSEAAQLVDVLATNGASLGDIPVRPRHPLLILQQQQDGMPLVGIGARQAVLGVGADAVEARIALGAYSGLLGPCWRSSGSGAM